MFFSMILKNEKNNSNLNIVGRNVINLVLAFLFSYLMKTPEKPNRVFRGYKMEKLARNGLNNKSKLLSQCCNASNNVT